MSIASFYSNLFPSDQPSGDRDKLVAVWLKAYAAGATAGSEPSTVAGIVRKTSRGNWARSYDLY